MQWYLIVQEPLSRITFSAHPTCHDVNLFTASPERLDVIIGFHTGDLIWLGMLCTAYDEPHVLMSSRSYQLTLRAPQQTSEMSVFAVSLRKLIINKGSISGSPCTTVRWVPLSSTLFLVSHADGTIIVYDKERDDGTFIPQDPSNTSIDPTNPSHVSPDGTLHNEWDPTDNIFVTMPPWHPVTSGAALNVPGKSDKDKAVKNPVSHWRLSRRGVVGKFSSVYRVLSAIPSD